MNTGILIAGFGGQGILFAGKFLAYCGMLSGKEVSWLPSYGPEMRGGTANCSVVLSDTSIGSPIVDKPDILIVLNLPSMERFEPAVKSGGKVFVDSSLIAKKSTRRDIDCTYIPSSAIAEENALKGLANMVIIGRVMAGTALFTKEQMRAAMSKTVSERKKDLFEANLRALDLGMAYN